MSVHIRTFLVIACGVAVLAAAHRLAPPDSRTSQAASREIARIRHHLEAAEALLVSRDVARLSAAQRAARGRHIAELRAYRQRGVFPHNHQVRGRRTPVFVDEHGTRCAMAYLMEQSGEGTLVSKIAGTRNLARIRDLAGDPALVDWLGRNGLTLGEAARIQPEYGDGESVTNSGAQVASAVGLGVGLAGVGLNVSVRETERARSGCGMLGVVCGLLGAGLGIPALNEDGGTRVVGAIDIGLGLASCGLGIRHLNAKGKEPQQEAAREISPMMWCDRSGMRRVALVMRF